MESMASEKFTNKSVASRFVACTPSMIRELVRIGEIAYRFRRKLFYFYKEFSDFKVGYDLET